MTRSAVPFPPRPSGRPEAVPGLRSPAAGFDQPFEMLHACHERVQRTLGLLERLCEHLRTRGCDAMAREAARDVLRYFDIAAPLHHEDEELHIFPPLLAAGSAETVALVRALQADHAAMAAQWAAARPPLAAIAEGAATALAPAQEAALRTFAHLYAGHLRREEDAAYPAARALLPPEAQAPMGQEMARRRGGV
ncbi:hemerythrin domain-containing protein [Paracidovorax konjaci]|uniref:Hemerythrin HHE cation binding domain-containing protein n=1 Tax=Paracidovorax konjaci TaxID=32040 RepID=A0A1I1VDJ0_9BURK|nr:hemerythrin domain-containing protein [Paracidovorax konjaci]SFD80038.1 Hemerythrin HHE cation binding domain-containing protein [Paracidovorax konjaci]